MYEASTVRSTTDASREASARRIAYAVYFLHLAALVMVFPAIIGLVLNLVGRGDARGTWVESHFRFQLRSLLLWIVGGAVAIGLILLLLSTMDDLEQATNAVGLTWGALLVWMVVRIVNGITRLGARQAME